MSIGECETFVETLRRSGQVSRWLEAMTVLVAALLALASWSGTTSQTAFERCGETHLTVTNNTSDWVEVLMFGDYRSIPAGGSAVFWTNEPVTVDRVVRRRPGQQYHDSVTSAFSTERRECTFAWATL